MHIVFGAVSLPSLSFHFSTFIASLRHPFRYSLGPPFDSVIRRCIRAILAIFDTETIPSFDPFVPRFRVLSDIMFPREVGVAKRSPATDALVYPQTGACNEVPRVQLSLYMREQLFIQIFASSQIPIFYNQSIRANSLC